MSNCCMHQLIHSVVLWGEGSGIQVCWGLSSVLSTAQGTSPPDRNSWMRGLSAGWHVRSSSSGLASGLDHSDRFPVPSSLPQVRRGSSSALASSLGLSSKLPAISVAWGWGTELAFSLPPLVWSHLRDFSLMVHCLRSFLMAAWVPVASWMLVTPWASVTRAKTAA